MLIEFVNVAILALLAIATVALALVAVVNARHHNALTQEFEAAAQGLAKDGYLLQKDIPEIVKRGAAEWDFVQGLH